MTQQELRAHLKEGQVIPAQPLALDENGDFSEKHQKAVTRYYLDAGVGGLAVGVHSTQFEIREPEFALFEPVLRLAGEVMDEMRAQDPRPLARIAGLCGNTAQALREAELAGGLGYQAGLLSLAAWKEGTEDELVEHCRAVAAEFPVIGFYLQPSVGGRPLGYSFWRRFAEIENVVAIKVAPFNRYQTIDVVRAVVESGRDDIALYTGNDDAIVADLITPWEFEFGGARVARWFDGGLLGHWGVWTRAAVQLLERIKRERSSGSISTELLRLGVAVTDMNAAVFDPAHKFAGCIPGILEVLRRQGLVPSRRCLNPAEQLSPGQAEELDRVTAAYPELVDDAFVADNLARWLND